MNTQNTNPNRSPISKEAAYLARGRQLRSIAVKEFFIASLVYLKQSAANSRKVREECVADSPQCA